MSVGVGVTRTPALKKLEEIMVTREKVFRVIDNERIHQEKLRPHRNHPVAHELLLLNRYITQANEEWSDNVGDESALHVIRKIASIAVRCMETNGAPYRDQLDNST